MWLEEHVLIAKNVYKWDKNGFVSTGSSRKDNL